MATGSGWGSAAMAGFGAGVGAGVGFATGLGWGLGAGFTTGLVVAFAVGFGAGLTAGFGVGFGIAMGGKFAALWASITRGLFGVGCASFCTRVSVALGAVVWLAVGLGAVADFVVLGVILTAVGVAGFGVGCAAGFVGGFGVV